MFQNIQMSFFKLSFLIIIAITTISAVPLSLDHQEKTEYRVFESWASTDIKLVRFKFKWIIKNFILSDKENGESMYSPLFWGETKDDCQWNLQIYPKGKYKEDRDYVSLYLNMVSCDRNITAKYNLGILNAKQIKTNIKSHSNRFNMTVTDWGFRNFIKRDILVNEGNELLPNGELTVFCDFNITLDTESISGKFKQPLSKCPLGQDFAYLFENDNFTDVTLFANGKEFRALKAILAARSSVFKDMFEHDLQDAKIIRIEITDVDPEVAKEMLRYIYTEKVLNLDYLASSLLVVAEKYQLDGLKTLSENYLCGNLTIENAADLFIVADTYFANELKKQAKDFIIAHISSVGHTPGFKSMIQTHPQLIEALFSEMSIFVEKER